MKVQLYAGSMKLVEKSGVGRAIHHQQTMLERNAIQTTYKNSRDAAIIHINTVFPNALLAALRAKLHGQLIVYYGHSTKEDFKNSFKLSNTLAPLFQRWIKLCYSMGDVVITPTPYSREILLGYGIKKPIYALSNGIDTDFFHADEQRRRQFREKYQLREDEKAVISVGHYIGRKGIVDFIELARTMPQVRFFWFGYTNPSLIPKEIQDAIAAAPSNLNFAGYVEPEQLRDAYCGCDLFCFLSHEETEGIVVLEALSCSIPVLVRDIPVYDSWLTDGVNAHKGRTLAEFQRKTAGILNETLPNLTAAGRKTAEERGMRAMGGKLLAIYQKTARGERVPVAAEHSNG